MGMIHLIILDGVIPQKHYLNCEKYLAVYLYLYVPCRQPSIGRSKDDLLRAKTKSERV